MPKLKSLQPKLKTFGSTQKTARLTTSWREGKSSTQRGYGYKWQQYRLKFLQTNPLCNFCTNQGLVTEATVVDHIQPHEGDMKLFWESANHQALCKKCHDSIKQKIERNHRSTGGVQKFK